MMAVLEDSLKMIREDYGEEIDLGRLPANDPAVYDALQKADTVGMFQIESRAQMSCLPRLRPKCFYDIVVQVAIIRPGPIVGKMVHPYLKRRQGREAAGMPSPFARARACAHSGRAALSGAIAAHGHDRRRIHGRRSGGIAPRLRFQTFRSAHERSGDKTSPRHGEKWNHFGELRTKSFSRSLRSRCMDFPNRMPPVLRLLAYASAYLKCHYLGAFTAAMLNNQPMGFYHPATLVKDAQRHGLKIRPIDVTRSDWLCTLERFQEKGAQGLALRLGLRYVKGLRAEIAQEIVLQRAVRSFASIDDLKLRIPAIHKSELAALAEIGALNFIEGKRNADGENRQTIHRRDALWQIERAARRPGPLFETLDTETKKSQEQSSAESDTSQSAIARPAAVDSPLAPMTIEERLVADFRGTGMTVGPHPLAYHRAELKRRGMRSAIELEHLPDGTHVRFAGAVIARQRPGTAKGFVFLSLEDETGIANAIITPQLFEQDHTVVIHHQFLLIEGRLQNQDNVISVKVERIQPLRITRAETTSHDFH